MFFVLNYEFKVKKHPIDNWGDPDAGSENYKIENGIETYVLNQVRFKEILNIF